MQEAKAVARRVAACLAPHEYGWNDGVDARVAQLVEHTLGKGEVTGSIPVASSEHVREA